MQSSLYRGGSRGCTPLLPIIEDLSVLQRITTGNFLNCYTTSVTKCPLAPPCSDLQDGTGGIPILDNE